MTGKDVAQALHRALERLRKAKGWNAHLVATLERELGRLLLEEIKR